MTEVKTLRDVPVGQSVRVLKLQGEGAVKRRIMDMGITRGAELRVCRTAPFGDPIAIAVRGFTMSLRKKEAENVLVDQIL